MTVTDTGSTWSNSGSVYVGGSAGIDGGNGTLSITNQGLVDIGGTLKLWPGGNVALDGGTLETANMQLAGGSFNWNSGLLRFSADLSVEPSGPLGGSLLVGAGKTLVASRLYVGAADSGTLDILAGGSVANGSASIGKGKVTVDGDDSQWTTYGSPVVGLLIGVEGNGALEITNGATVFTSAQALSEMAVTAAYIAFETGTTGAVVIDGTGSEWIVDAQNTGLNLAFAFTYVGWRVDGTLQITNGGRLRFSSSSNGSYTYLGSSSGSSGTLIVDGAGSTWGGGIFGQLGPDSVFVGNAEGGDGTLKVTNGGTMLANVYVGSSGRIEGNGFIGGLVENGGLVSPGVSPGTLTIGGNYSQTADGELLIELASASSFDQLLVTGTVTLAGTLTVDFLDGFIPSIGQTYTILTADDVDFEFTTETLPSVPGLFFDVIYNVQSVVLEVIEVPIPGDFDFDRDVDGDDFLKWQRGESFTPYSPADLADWEAFYGTVAPSSLSAATAVPEPSTWMLLSLAAMGSNLTMRRRIS